jgi:LuxR family transcriptional regulator, maltose regulon positive regulatory protein
MMSDRRHLAVAGSTRAHRFIQEAPAFDVVESKVHVPPLRPGTVSRTALVNRLRAHNACPLVTISAPAGYGKTTLLAQWSARDSRPFAWVSVDERDNDPIVLLRHLGAALHAIEPLDATILEALSAPGVSIWTRALPRVAAAVRAFPEPLVIVLDDSHILESQGSLEAVSVVADHVPDQSLLVLAGRVTPKLRIPALRASGRLLELESDALALNPREGQLLIRSAGAHVSLEDATEIVRRCEGWPAAIYLAALALREDHSRPVSFVGVDRHIADYLRSEYLARLRPVALRFLRRTSVLERMCGSLCDAVLEQKSSARELEKIERANLFLVPLDRERIWYRYHHLFRDQLLRDLAEREPELLPVLHRRAANWYEQQGDAESALEHADAAGDLRRAARIITAIALPVYYSGRVATVEGWIARFDDPRLLRRYPGVALQGAWVHALRGRPAEAERWLQIAEAGTFRGRLADGSTSLRPWIAILRAAMCGEGAEQMVAGAESALAELPADSQLRPSALIALGAGRMLLRQNEQADETFALAAAEASRLGATDTQVVAVSERSLVAFSRNDLDAAERYALEAHDLVERNHLDGYVTSAMALAASARASLRHGRWDDARVKLAQVQRLQPLLRDSSFPWFALQTRLELARAYLALRDTRSVRSLLGQIKMTLREHPQVGALADQAKSLERQLAAMPRPAGSDSAGLTSAELRLLPLLATHLSFREIGEQLFVSRNTIKTQAISVYRKLGVSSRSEAISRASDLGLIELGAHVV